MKTNPDHEKKRTKFNTACEDLTCANCGQPRATGSTLCADCLPIKDGAQRVVTELVGDPDRLRMTEPVLVEKLNRLRGINAD